MFLVLQFAAGVVIAQVIRAMILATVWILQDRSIGYLYIPKEQSLLGFWFRRVRDCY